MQIWWTWTTQPKTIRTYKAYSQPTIYKSDKLRITYLYRKIINFKELKTQLNDFQNKFIQTANLDFGYEIFDIKDFEKLNFNIYSSKNNSKYDWHVDTSRGVCVNMLLNDVESKCLFSIEQGEITRTFKELKYKPETYYLFNNQVEHTVINFTQNRYLMSVEFEEGKDVLTFNNLLKEIIWAKNSFGQFA